MLLDEFRMRSLPVFYSVMTYEPHLRDGGVFVEKVPALKILIRGSEWVEVDARVRRLSHEPLVEKKFASAFFGTDLDMALRAHGVDTLVTVGCTTSGNIRATAIDSMQHGFRTVVVRDAVGDRSKGAHEANLFDIGSKYGDVVTSQTLLEQLRALGSRASAASERFVGWWARR